MTKTNMDLSELLAKDDQGDLLRSIAEAVLQLIMEADVDGLIGAGRHERSGERTTWRNGYRDRSLDTRPGTLNLRVPKLRQGSYFPGFLEGRKTSEQVLVAVIQEAWIGGVSTRRVDELVQAMGLSGISKSTVSKLCKDIDERVGEFLNRPLTGEWPYVWLDATYLKVRQGGRIVPVAAIIAVAANTEGRREIIGLGIGPSEAEAFWTEFLRSLKARGLDGVRLVISDAHSGLKAAIARVFEATWQRCRVHWMRNALAHVSRGQHTVVAAAIRQACGATIRMRARIAASKDVPDGSCRCLSQMFSAKLVRRRRVRSWILMPPRCAKFPHRAALRGASGRGHDGWRRTPDPLQSRLARPSGGVAPCGAMRRDRRPDGQPGASRAARAPSAPGPRQSRHAARSSPAPADRGGVGLSARAVFCATSA